MGEVIYLYKGGGSMDKITYEDIADYFIAKAKESGALITNLKLQKMVYYAQAWHITIFDEKLFDKDFQAWVHGPVLPELYDDYKQFSWKPIEREDLDVDDLKDIENKLGEQKTEFMEELMDEYFGMNAYELERLTHEEEPWKKARSGLDPDEKSTNEIKTEWMEEYYSNFREM